MFLLQLLPHGGQIVFRPVALFWTSFDYVVHSDGRTEGKGPSRSTFCLCRRVIGFLKGGRPGNYGTRRLVYF